MDLADYERLLPAANEKGHDLTTELPLSAATDFWSEVQLR